MNPVMTASDQCGWRESAGVAMRWLLGGVFIWMGLQKVMFPVDFLKVMREYQVGGGHEWLNLIAAVLPWFEVFCGTLLVAGVAVRGTAVVLLAMLVPFTVLVTQRALGILMEQRIPFCAIRFDCGCGAGEVNVCGKILENMILMLLAAALVVWGAKKWALRHDFSQRT